MAINCTFYRIYHPYSQNEPTGDDQTRDWPLGSQRFTRPGCSTKRQPEGSEKKTRFRVSVDFFRISFFFSIWFLSDLVSLMYELRGGEFYFIVHKWILKFPAQKPCCNFHWHGGTVLSEKEKERERLLLLLLLLLTFLPSRSIRMELTQWPNHFCQRWRVLLKSVM